MKIDLHVHTTASDGRLSPAQLVGLAARLGVAVIGITDHDSLDGIEPALAAARDFPSVKVIPGVEINTDVPHGEVHILGYFMDYHHKELQDTLERLRRSREIRAQTMIAKLKNLGINIQWERVQQLAANGAVGRPHVAQAMLEGGFISSLKEAFDKYIGREGPAYADREKLAPADAVKVLVNSGGLPVLAHPADTPDMEAFVVGLKAVGLAGIEVYYAGYSPDIISSLLSLSRKYGLVPTGGSDYHGFGDASETMLGDVAVPYEVAGRLAALARRHSLKFG